MFPLYDIKKFSNEAALDKVRSWSERFEESYDDNVLFQGVPGDFGLNPYSQARKRPAKKNENEIWQLATKLYEIVVDSLGGQFHLSKDKFSEMEKNLVVSSLHNNGYDVFLEDFKDIICVAKVVRKNLPRQVRNIYNTDWDMESRPASLNCYDYERFKNELNDLIKHIGYSSLELYCHTLCRIMTEVAEGEDNPYPGRHLPLDRLNGRSAWRYQCLRIMDEILCTSDRTIKDDEMEKLIVEKAVEYHILKDINQPYPKISKNTFKKLHATLNQLISVEYTQGTKKEYNNLANDSKAKEGHLYKKLENGKRTNAFYLEFTIREAERLRSEIGMIRALFFNDDHKDFSRRFPLLASMGRISEIFIDADYDEKLINEINGTDIVTVNYRPAVNIDLKERIEKACKYKLPIYVNDQRVIPLYVKMEGINWALIAKDMDSDKICVFSSNDLNSSFNEQENPADLSDDNATEFADHIIGIGKLLIDKPCYVTLHLTEKGIESISNTNSPFTFLNPVINKHREFRCSKYDEAGTASFNVYINEDLFDKIHHLDKNGKLVSIEPPIVSDLYKDYYDKYYTGEYLPLEERKPSMKCLRGTTKRVSE